MCAAMLVAGAAASATDTKEVRAMQQITSLAGRTIRWTFTDGPTAGITFDHEFKPDGSVEWHALNGAYKGASRHEKHYGAVKIDDHTWAVSYLAASGNTLTVVLNFANQKAIAFASSDKTWDQINGTFEVVK
jgi:hypothetical protein